MRANVDESTHGMIEPKVYLLTETFYPPYWDGVSRHAHELAHGLAQKSQSVCVVTRQSIPPAPNYERIGKVSVRRIGPGGFLKGAGWRAVMPLASFLVQLFRVLLKDRSRYTVVVTCGVKVLPIPATIACALLRKKCILRVESPTDLLEDISAQSLADVGVFQRRILLGLAHAVQRAALRRADRIVAISSEIARELIRNGVGLEKIAPIPNGVDTNRFAPATGEQKKCLRRELHLPVEQMLFTFTGRLAVSKGVLLLVRAWKHLSTKHRGIHLVLVGSGEGS